MMNRLRKLLGYIRLIETTEWLKKDCPSAAASNIYAAHRAQESVLQEHETTKVIVFSMYVQ
jgi:hypothetical protein